MTAHQEGRARTARPSARPHRPRSTDALSILPDITLAALVVALALAIIVDPSAGPIDGRHLLAGAAALTLITRTHRAARR